MQHKRNVGVFDHSQPRNSEKIGIVKIDNLFPLEVPKAHREPPTIAVSEVDSQIGATSSKYTISLMTGGDNIRPMVDEN